MGTDHLKKTMQLGTVEALRAAVQEAENENVAGRVMDDAWTLLGKKTKALDTVNMQVKFGTAEDLYRSLKDAEHGGLIAEDLQEAYQALSKMTKGKRGFGKIPQLALGKK